MPSLARPIAMLCLQPVAFAVFFTSRPSSTKSSPGRAGALVADRAVGENGDRSGECLRGYFKYVGNQIKGKMRMSRWGHGRGSVKSA